jgi:type I restriction enzyme S subunit
MASEWSEQSVAELQAARVLLVEDGNHGENRPRPDEFSTEGVQFIRAADMDSGRVLFESAQRINEAARQRVRKGIGAGGDVLLSHKGTVGKVAYVPSDAPPFVCSPQTTFWRVKDPNKLDRRYLYFYLLSRAFREQLDSRKGETDMADYVSLTTQRTLKVTVPPLAEQQSIAAVLGALDDKIELNRRMNVTLEAMARALFQSWFVDFDPVRAKLDGRQPVGMDEATAALFPNSFEETEAGHIPKGWMPLRLSDAIEVNPRRLLRKGSVAPYLDMKNLPTQGHSAEVVIDREFSSGSKFQNGDTLLARITPCLENGKTGYVDFLEDGQVGWGSTEYIVFAPKSPLPPQFGYLLARSDALRSHAIQNMTGTSGRQRVPSECFNTFWLAVPSPEVARRFDELTSPLMAKIKANSTESSTLATLRDTLLPKLLSGEIATGLTS